MDKIMNFNSQTRERIKSQKMNGNQEIAKFNGKFKSRKNKSKQKEN